MISHSSQSFTNREYVEFIIFVIFSECYFNDKLEWDVKTTPCCTEFLNTGATIRDENGCVRSVLLWDPSVNVNNSNCYSLPKFIKTVLSQLVQGRPQEGVSGWGDHGECGARTYNGGLGSEPPAGSRGRVPGQGGEAPQQLKAFWSLDVQRSQQI